MGYYVPPLKRPYDVSSLIEVYVRTQRTDFAHSDFKDYYEALLNVLLKRFGIDFSHEGIPDGKTAFWFPFRATVASLNQITGPWSGFLEAGLIVKELEESGETGTTVNRASDIIRKANDLSNAAHREILHSLFAEIFGKSALVVTSQELLDAGFDDSKEPNTSDYHDYM